VIVPARSTKAINEIIQEIIALARGEMSRNRVTLQTQLSEDFCRFVLGDRI